MPSPARQQVDAPSPSFRSVQRPLRRASPTGRNHLPKLLLMSVALGSSVLVSCGAVGGGSSSGESQSPPPLVPASIAAAAGNGQSATVSSAFATNLGVTVTDSAGNVVSNVGVTFTAPPSGASGTFANGTATTTATTNSSGVGTASTFTANSTAGSYSITASVSGVSTNARFSLTNNNPVPTITSLTPSSATAGAAAQTLTINGTNFISTSTVTYDGVAHAATFISSSELTVSLSASDQTAAGNYAVVVTNLAPGGGSSNVVNFTVTLANNGLQISSLSETTANPFDSLTISGSGLNAGTSAISVLFVPENGDAAVMIPVSEATSSGVQVMVPAFISLTSGAFTAETVDVQVVEFTSSVLYLSNRVTGLQVNAFPTVRGGTPVGSMTAALLLSTLNISGSILTAEGTNATFSNTATALAQFNSDAGALISAISTISGDPTQSVSLITANGGTVALNAQTLALSDQLAQALVTAIVNQGSIPIAASSSCPITGNTTYDTDLCSVQTYFQTLGGQSPPAPAFRRLKYQITSDQLTPQEAAVAALWTNLILGSLAEAAEPAGGEVIYQFIVAPIVTTTIAELLVYQEAPTGAKIAQGVGTGAVDELFLHGTPGLSTTVDVIEALGQSAPWSPPPEGMLPSSGVAVLVQGQVTAVVPGPNAPPEQVMVPDQTQAGTFDLNTLQIPSQPTPYTLTLSTTGSGSGLVYSSPSGTTIPGFFSADTIVGVTAAPASGSIFASWGGSCSGNLGSTCTVTMTHNQSVSAEFDINTGGTEVWSGTMTGTTTDSASSGAFVGCNVSGSNGTWNFNYQITFTFNGSLVSAIQSNGSSIGGSGSASGTQSVAGQLPLNPENCQLLPSGVSDASLQVIAFAPSTASPVAQIQLQGQSGSTVNCTSDSIDGVVCAPFFFGLQPTSVSSTQITGTYPSGSGNQGSFTLVKQ
jgi:hypothetical protein